MLQMDIDERDVTSVAPHLGNPSPREVALAVGRDVRSFVCQMGYVRGVFVTVGEEL
jgi:hypothetical protein